MSAETTPEQVAGMFGGCARELGLALVQRELVEREHTRRKSDILAVEEISTRISADQVTARVGVQAVDLHRSLKLLAETARFARQDLTKAQTLIASTVEHLKDMSTAPHLDSTARAWSKHAARACSRRATSMQRFTESAGAIVAALVEASRDWAVPSAQLPTPGVAPHLERACVLSLPRLADVGRTTRSLIEDVEAGGFPLQRMQLTALTVNSPVAVEQIDHATALPPDHQLRAAPTGPGWPRPAASSGGGGEPDGPAMD